MAACLPATRRCRSSTDPLTYPISDFTGTSDCRSCSDVTVSFAEHLTLLDGFLRARQEIAARIEQRLLNVRGKETSRRRDRAHFSALLNDCFFGAPGVPRDAAALKGQLAQAHLEDGFEPVRIDKYAHELDPLELLPRTYEYWEATRWPGSS